MDVMRLYAAPSHLVCIISGYRGSPASTEAWSWSCMVRHQALWGSKVFGFSLTVTSVLNGEAI
jgi:hypothetical protein